MKPKNDFLFIMMKETQLYCPIGMSKFMKISVNLLFLGKEEMNTSTMKKIK